MCLLVLAWRVHPRYRLIVAANRDEFHQRAAAHLAPWRRPPILAGRDLEAGGTWLGVDRGRRFGIVTNFRDMARRPPEAQSRGGLIPGWLTQPAGPLQYASGLAATADRYAGFNLLIADGESLQYASNRADGFTRVLPPGVYGLANHLLDSPWPKLLRVRRGFEQWLERPAADPRALFSLLADRRPARDDELPHAGLPRDRERALSSPFVVHAGYGTRCSTVLAIGRDDSLEIDERSFDETGAPTGTASFRLAPGEWPAASPGDASAGNPPAPGQL